MKKLFLISLVVIFFIACSSTEESGTPATTVTAADKVKYTQPEPLSLPEYKEPKSDSDWAAKVNNKEIEIIQVLNIINPVAAFIVAGFEQYGDRITELTVHEEWKDTQELLTKALELYESCKTNKAAGKFNKQLFLDLEGTWQMLVKTGVAGVRTKSMLEAKINNL
jgi:hypothetical protein